MTRMKICTLLSALVLLPWESAAATPKVLAYDFAKVKRELPTQKLEQRDGGVTVNLVNDQIMYLVNISVGTPPQAMSVQLDTGSSDLWVPSVNSTLCKENHCGQAGSFNPSSSSSFVLPKDASPFEIYYGDNSSYHGSFFVDTLHIGESTTKNVKMGLVQTADNVIDVGPVGMGIWGISVPDDQTSAFLHDPPPYQTVLQLMKKDGTIKSVSYSLWLDSIDAKGGSILFGGVDSAKYAPPLIGVPIIKYFDEYLGMIVDFTSLSLKDPSGNVTLISDDAVVLAILDSGSTSSHLPKSLVDTVYSYFGVRLEYGRPFLPCNLATANASLTFGFGGANGPKITVPISTFVSAPDNEHFADGTEACLLLLEYSDDGLAILGDSFLRSAYVVYDLDNHQIALAQSNLSPGAPNITEIDGDTIANVASVVSASQVPDITSIFSNLIFASSTPTPTEESAIPSNFDGTFSDSAPQASITGKAAPSSTSQAAAAGGADAMIWSKGYLWCGAVSIISALLGGSLMMFK